MDARSVIVAGARTPIGRLGGAVSTLKASDLAGVAIKSALERAGIAPDRVDHVILGQVLQAGQGLVAARQAAVAGGIPFDVSAITLNKACLSGINAIHLADLMIRAGEAEIVVAGGMESMSQAPYLLPGARVGLRYGDAPLLDAIQADALSCPFDHLSMGAATESYARSAGIGRARQDEFAALSHERAAKAAANGLFAEEIANVAIAQRRGDPVIVSRDEGIRPETTHEVLVGMRPAFSPDGTVTVGNASQISDGAAAVIVVSSAVADKLGLRPLGELVAHGQVAGPDPSLLTQPSRAIRDALSHSTHELSDIDLFEINEAFAAVAVASLDDLGVSPELVNVNGGAIALGHPVGMSGARIVLTLCHELRRRGGGLGAAALCGGTGQGEALLVRVAAD